MDTDMNDSVDVVKTVADGIPSEVLDFLEFQEYFQISSRYVVRAPLVVPMNDFFEDLVSQIHLGANLLSSSVMYGLKNNADNNPSHVLRYIGGVDSAEFFYKSGRNVKSFDFSFDDTVRFSEDIDSDARDIISILGNIVGGERVESCLYLVEHPASVFIDVLKDASSKARVGLTPEFVGLKDLSPEKCAFSVAVEHPGYKRASSLGGAWEDYNRFRIVLPVAGTNRIIEGLCIDDLTGKNSRREIVTPVQDKDSLADKYMRNILGMDSK